VKTAALWILVLALVGSSAWAAVSALVEALTRPGPCHTDSECSQRHGGDGGPAD